MHDSGALNVRGPCSSCGAQLASDQRYCIECGQRMGPPLALPYALPAHATGPPAGGGWLSALPMPVQMVSAFAALALGFGAVVGTALSPDLAGISAAPSPGVIAEPPLETPPASTGGGGGGGGAPPPSSGGAPAVASTASPASSGPGGGGGGGKRKQKTEKKPAPQIFSGTVVRANPVAGSYTITTGSLDSIHADSLPDVGQKLEVPVRELANGTFAETGQRNSIGIADSASFTGTVTYCADLQQPEVSCAEPFQPDDKYVYTVSALGASVLVSAPDSASGPPPAVGSRVEVTVQIGNKFEPIDPVSPTPPDPTCTPPPNGLPSPPVSGPELTQTAVNITGQPSSSSLEAVVQITCPGESPELILSADDLRQAERDLPVFAVPNGIDLAKLGAGQAVQAAVDIDPDGTLTLRGITSDDGAAGADDPTQRQGSLAAP